MQRAMIALLAAALSGCAALGAPNGSAQSGANGIDAAQQLLPTNPLLLASALALPPQAAMATALAYVATDPLGPMWRIEEAQLAPQRYRISLRKKRYVNGGDGEAAGVFRRHAEKIASTQGAAGYVTLEFTESVESTFPLAQRVASGVIELR